MARRRRWVRNSKRFKKAADMTDDEVDPTRLVDFGGGQGGGMNGADGGQRLHEFGSPSMVGAIPLQSMSGPPRNLNSELDGDGDPFSSGDL